MTTVLFIGDQHFKITNINEVELFISKITKLAQDKTPDIIVLAGDLLDCHERLHTTPLNKAYEFINSMRKISKTYVLVGNHDIINNSQYLTENHWLNSMKEWDNTIIVDKVLTERINDQIFVFIPYVPPGRFEEALNTLDDDHKTDWKKANCIFAHQEFFGCKMGAITSVEGDKWPLEYPEVVSGHIHSKQRPQKNIYYPGSAMQHAFGESTKNIIAHFTFTGDKYDLDEIDLNLPRKKIVYMDIENIEDYTAPETDDKIKITVSGSYDQFKALKKTKKYKKLIDKGLKVVFKPKKIDHKEEIPENILNETTFSNILNEIINQQKDNYLYETYQLVVNNKEVNNKDIMYLDN
jgi:DNA repair exonuclease SbcCD nuclease subunit